MERPDMRLLDAVTLAAKLHDGQRDKNGEPYIAHCVRVMLRLPPNASLDEKIAALLHDAVEDIPGAASRRVVPHGRREARGGRRWVEQHDESELRSHMTQSGR
jgi:hypothetical protein